MEDLSFSATDRAGGKSVIDAEHVQEKVYMHAYIYKHTRTHTHTCIYIHIEYRYT